MSENINLCEILKGHEGEIFYSPLYGNVKLIRTNYSFNQPIYIESSIGASIPLTKYGYYHIDNVGEMQLFPSKEQRNWNKWLKKQKSKIPKTWSELLKSSNS